MSASGKSVMIGIRHRCGQIIQFWIPADWVLPVLERSYTLESEDLGAWMAEQGWMPDSIEEQPPDLVEHLREQLEPRGVAFIDVEKDESVCPRCSSLVRWMGVVADLAAGSRSDGGGSP